MGSIPADAPDTPARRLLRALQANVRNAPTRDRDAAAAACLARWEIVGVELTHRADVMGMGPATESLLADMHSGRL